MGATYVETVPTQPDGVIARALSELSDAMDSTDDELFAAERRGDRSQRIVLLLERSRLWQKYGELLESVGRESWKAFGCARRDHSEALTLQTETEHRA